MRTAFGGVRRAGAGRAPVTRQPDGEPPATQAAFGGRVTVHEAGAGRTGQRAVRGNPSRDAGRTALSGLTGPVQRPQPGVTIRAAGAGRAGQRADPQQSVRDRAAPV